MLDTFTQALNKSIVNSPVSYATGKTLADCYARLNLTIIKEKVACLPGSEKIENWLSVPLKRKRMIEAIKKC